MILSTDRDGNYSHQLVVSELSTLKLKPHET